MTEDSRRQEENGKAKSKQVYQAPKGTRAYAKSEGKNGETAEPEE